MISANRSPTASEFAPVSYEIHTEAGRIFVFDRRNGRDLALFH